MEWKVKLRKNRIKGNKNKGMLIWEGAKKLLRA